MTTWFISRHPGAIAWAKENNLPITHWETHLDPQDVESGDTVIGTLPMNVAALVCERGAMFYALNIDMSQEARGKELSATAMWNMHCSLSRYDIRRL